MTNVPTSTPIVHETNYTALLVAVLALLIFSPFLDLLLVGDYFSSVFMDSLISVVLLSAIYDIQRRKTLFIVSCVFLCLSLVSLWTSYAVPDSSLQLASHGFGFLFSIVITGMILAQVLQERQVTLHVVSGAICAYLIMGLAWAFLFSLLEGVRPGSFNLPAILTQEGQTVPFELRRMELFLYHSLVTLTTLGYGDVTPVSYPARNLSVVEAILGQLYIAVLIARLVGLSMTQKDT